RPAEPAVARRRPTTQGPQRSDRRERSEDRSELAATGRRPKGVAEGASGELETTAGSLRTVER
ncbi:MAG: hypothetical protein ABEJ27_01370, partial [Halodesulfurarchaeum sp.]